MLIPASASATVLWVGGEDSSVSFIGTSDGLNAGVTTKSGTFRNGYGRESLWVQGSTASPPSYLIKSPTFTAGSTLWIHAEADLTASFWTPNQQMILVYSPDGVARILIRASAADGTLKISSENAAGTITDLASSNTPISGLSVNAGSFSLHKIDLDINYTCSSLGSVNLYIDGQLYISFSGNPCTDSATQLNRVALSTITDVGGGWGCDGGNASTCWSELIAANQDTRGMSLWTLPPQAAGNTQSWTPNTVGNINPTTINDSNYISTASSSELSEWTTPTSAPAGSWIVDALVQEARVLGGTTGPQHFEWLVRTKDGTDNVASSTAPTQGSFNNFFHVWSLNPKTGLGWLMSDIAAGFNTGIESLP